MKHLIIFSFSLIVFAACKKKAAIETPIATESSTPVVEDEHEPTDMETKSEEALGNHFCFALITPSNVIEGMNLFDSVILSYTITDNVATGVFKTIPAEMDRTIGKFTGNVNKKGEIKAIYAYDSEGETYKDGLIIIPTEKAVRIKQTALEFANQELEIVDDATIDFISLPIINCAKIE